MVYDDEELYDMFDGVVKQIGKGSKSPTDIHKSLNMLRDLIKGETERIHEQINELGHYYCDESIGMYKEHLNKEGELIGLFAVIDENIPKNVQPLENNLRVAVRLDLRKLDELLQGVCNCNRAGGGN